MLNKYSNLQQRIITGLTGAVLLVTGVWWSAWTYFIVFGIISSLSLFEFYKLIRLSGREVNSTLGVIFGLILYSGVFFYLNSGFDPIYFLLLIPSLFLVFVVELFRAGKNPFSIISYTILGVFYVAVPFALLTASSYFSGEYSPSLVFGLLIIIWGNDIGGYIAGKSFGKHKLYEKISPKKTWEGSIGGVLLGMSASLVLSYFFEVLSVFQWLGMSLLIVVMGSIGDLVESMLKRSLDIKDSGSMIPGHGGFLDRFDGLIFSLPFVSGYLLIFCN